MTIYEDVSPNDPHIQYFWRALEEFDSAQHAEFLRFAWARSRVPVSGILILFSLIIL